MVLRTETFNQSVCTEYSEAVNARYTFQPLWVSGVLALVLYVSVANSQKYKASKLPKFTTEM